MSTQYTTEVPLEKIRHTHQCPQEEKVQQLMSWGLDILLESYPPLVRLADDGYYDVVDGTHMLLALERFGITHTQVIVQ